MREKKRQVPQNISGENLLFGLTISSSVLLLLLQLVIIGAVVFTNLQNQDLRMVGNQECGKYYEGEAEEEKPRLSFPEESYDHMGNLGRSLKQ